VTEPRIFDHTAIVALFDGNRTAFELWQQADRGEANLVLPAAAVAEANHVLGGDSNTWQALLYPGHVVITPLDGLAAIGTGTLAGSLVVRHVVHEAQQVRGAIVTRAPWQYPAGDLPIRPI
jgi:hypothetical protein